MRKMTSMFLIPPACRPETPKSDTSRLDTPRYLPGRVDPTPVISLLGTPDTEMPDSPGLPASKTVSDAPGPSSRTASGTPGLSSRPDPTSTDKVSYEPEKKRRKTKMTKLEKAEESSDALFAKVLADQQKRRAEAAEIERKRLELAKQIAEREVKRDRQFMLQMQQMMALRVQSAGALSYPPAPFPTGYQPGPGCPLGSQPAPGIYPGPFVPLNQPKDNMSAPTLDTSNPPPGSSSTNFMMMTLITELLYYFHAFMKSC